MNTPVSVKSDPSIVTDKIITRAYLFVVDHAPDLSVRVQFKLGNRTVDLVHTRPNELLDDLVAALKRTGFRECDPAESNPSVEVK